MESFVSIKKTQMRASLLHAFLKVLTVRGFPSPWQFQLITHWTRWCCQATTTNPRLSAMIFPKVRVSSSNFCFLSMDVAWEWVWLLGLRFGPTKGNVSYKSSVCFRGPTLFHVPWDGSKVFFWPMKRHVHIILHVYEWGITKVGVGGTRCLWSEEKVTGWSIDGVSFWGVVDLDRKG